MIGLRRQDSDLMEHLGRGISRTGKERLRNLGIEPISNQNGENGSSSEIYFADLFEAYVARMTQYTPKRCVPKFSALYREIPATVGIADFIGLIAPRWRYTEQRLAKKLHGLPRGPVAEILSRLDYKRRVSREDLFNMSHYSKPVVSMAVYGLLNAKVVRNGDDQKYLLDSKFKLPQADIHFYEIKMEKWRRALFQANQAQVYADKTYCIMPPHKKQVLLDNGHLFRSAGVGVILFDPERWKLLELIPGRKAKPKKPADKLDVLIRLATARNLLS